VGRSRATEIGEERQVADQWMIRGTEFTNCNCAWGCPCQFGAKTTYGHCETVMCGRIHDGNFKRRDLDGLNWAVLMSWPGEVAEGNGTQQAIIDERRTLPSEKDCGRSFMASRLLPERRISSCTQHDVDRAGNAVRPHRVVDRCCHLGQWCS